jgi:prolyl oligopeptidase
MTSDPFGIISNTFCLASVPLSIVYSKDIKLDGQNPTMLYAYGAYGISINSSFDPSLLAWFRRGGVYAIAHVRGGGEKAKIKAKETIGEVKRQVGLD